MIKNLSIALAISVCVTACGGGGGGGGSKSSAPASSAPASSAPASSVAPSSKPASSVPGASSTPASSSSASSVDPGVIVISPLVYKASTNGKSNVNPTNNDLTVSFSGEYGGAEYKIQPPISVPTGLTLDGSVYEVTVNVSNEFKTSKAGLQLFAFINNGTNPWPTKGDCKKFLTGELVVGSQKINCKLDMGGVFNSKSHEFGVGLQAVNDPVETTTYNGTISITDTRIVLGEEGDIVYPSSSSSSSSSSSTSSAGPVVIDLPASTWYGIDGATQNGTTFTFAGYQGIAFWLDPAEAAIENATVEVDLNISSAFKTSGASLQIYVEIKAAPWDGKKDCGWLNSTDITPGVTQKISCVLNSGGALTQTATGVEVKILGVGGSTPSGAVTIEGGKITLPN